MPNTDYATTLGVGGVKSTSALLTALEKRGIYVVADAETSTALTPGNVIYLIFKGVVFWYDAADSTTAHDGVTCCVTADGKRFKSGSFGGAQSRFFPIVSRTLTTPPGSPTLGKAYIVGVGSTGAWAGKDNYIATWTARQWVFTVPNVYDMAFVVAETLIYSYTVGGTWTAGIPFALIGANTISIAALKYNKFGMRIINQTTNTPPGSPADGDAYIVGPSPTGAWAGQTLKVALWETSAWVFYTAYNGAAVYDISIQAFVTFNGTLWISIVSGYSQITVSSLLSTSSLSPPAYTYSATTAPTVSNTSLVHTVNHTPRKSGATLKITVVFGSLAFSSGSGFLDGTVGIWIDGAASAADWSKCEIQTAGGLNHFVGTFIYTTTGTVAIAVNARFTAGGGAQSFALTRIRIIVEELA